MRFIKGHVDLVGLGQLLQDLSAHQAEGFLTLARGRDKQTVHFGPAGIRLLSSTLARVKRIARIARRTLGGSEPTADRLRALLKKEKLLGWTLGQLALSEAPLRREDVDEALRRQVEEEVLDLFMWSQATFEFKEGKLTAAKAREPLAHLELRANVTSLLLEAARREDEVRAIRQALGNDRGTLRKVRTEIHADVLGEDVVRADAILPLINGRRTLKAILRSSIYPIFSTLRAVQTLRTAGYVEVIVPTDTLSLIVS